MEQNKTFSSGKDAAGDTWYVDNYILLKEYYDMTISRIAARCVRSGNIDISFRIRICTGMLIKRFPAVSMP